MSVFGGQPEQSETAEAILTLEAHMSELQSLRDAARSAGQLSAAITAEVKRGELMRFYVKQVESSHVNKFSHMSDEELDAFIRMALRDLMRCGGAPMSAVHNTGSHRNTLEPLSIPSSSTAAALHREIDR